ncbi:UNVERIFIED_CONTAM: hypothetical protein GTU68_047433 [Idotea baltica]|nr:hypothetical protein [Idotea baltica]
MNRLRSSTLDQVNDTVTLPAYNRDNLQSGIVHLGLGAFHRAHQAAYTEQAIANSGGNWGIIGVSMRSADVSQQLSPQDALYSLLNEDGLKSQLQVIAAIRQVLVAPQDESAVATAIALPSIRIVTLTVTEKAYCLAKDGRTLDLNDSGISHDLTAPETPNSTLGILALGLRERLRGGGAPLTIISCDNLSGNSSLLRSLLQQYLQQTFPEVIPWMRNSTAFPCSMVDRIVPAMTEPGRQKQQQLLGLRDEAAVATEPFSQWIIENSFATDRPDWESAGVQFVEDIAPFEAIKLGLLNASHTAIAFCGLLAELDTVDQVMADDELSQFIQRLMNEDLMPLLEIPAGFDIAAYRDKLLQRFANPRLQHRCDQIAMDSSEKISQRWVPALHSAKVPSLQKMLSTWAYFILFSDRSIDDPRQQELSKARKSEAALPQRIEAVLACTRLAAASENELEVLVIAVQRHIDTIAKLGLRGLLNA